MSTLKKIFIKSPFFIKKLFVNAEAVRRDTFRRYGDYEKLKKNTDIKYIMETGYKKEQESLFKDLLSYVKDHVPRYKDIEIVSINDLDKLPILTKRELIEDIDSSLSTDIDKNKCFKSVTSGSTGTPLTYYHDKKGVRFNQLYADKLLELSGLNKEDKKVRISGVNIVPFECTKPPFWIYISKYKQLQCSAYHMRENTYGSYLEAMKQYGVNFGTGYATAWYFLAEYILKTGISVPKLKAIVTDSEGITKQQQEVVKQAFGCPVYQTYGLSEIGQVGFQCKNGNYHFIPTTCIAEIVDEDFNKVEEGTQGQILLTSLMSKETPFIRYATGDLGIMGKDLCGCGWDTPYLTNIVGRIDDYVLTPDGRKIGRLSHIIKDAKGVLESQLVQTDVKNLLIKIVPGDDFDESSMDTVIENAKNYLGQMNVKWEKVLHLERTKNGKIKYVIRKF